MAKTAASTHEPFFVIWLPRVIYAVAFVAFVSSFTSPDAWLGRVIEFIATWFVPLPLFNFLSVILALMIATGLQRHKRIAWRILLIVLTLYAVLCVLTFVIVLVDPPLEDLNVEASELWLIRLLISVNFIELVSLMVGLIVYRAHYVARVRKGNFLRAVGVLILGLCLSILATLLLQGMTRGFTTESMRQLFLRLTHPDAQRWNVADWVPNAFGIFLSFSVIAAFAVLMSSQRESSTMTLADEARIRGLIAQYGGDSLSYFSTRRDKSVVFSERAAVTFRAVFGCCLASGDPVGDPNDWPNAARAFISLANSYGWTPAVIAASERGAKVYQQAGLRVLQLGDEALLTPSRFNLAELPEVRRAVRKLTDSGYQLRIRRHGDIPDEDLTMISQLADEWRSGEEERGFSMALGRFNDPADRDCLLVEALFPDKESGSQAGLLSFVPWGNDSVSLDVMRRHPHAENGVTEFMVAGLLAASDDFGVKRVSLNFAVFREAFSEGAELGATPLKRFNRRVMLFASRWWQLESLYRSNAKYDPVWSPRLIAYREASDLANVALAMAVAEGFVKLPTKFTPSIDQPRLTPAQALPMLPAKPAPLPPACLASEQIKGRIDRRRVLLEAGIQPYPVDFCPDATCADLEGTGSVSGRVLAIRDHGGVVFVHLQDWSGGLQLLLERDRLGEELDRFTSTVQLGDQIGVSGTIGESRTKTRSLLVREWTLTNKALRPMPSLYYGIRDPEAKVRQRYLDLIVNPDARQRLRVRSTAFRAVRETLLSHDYLEVETPILQAVHGGANARPFITHINAYNMRLYLRIAPELYLKRLLVGGVPRVFEMGRNFRNEGADATHNPEFTMLEAYHAYADYNVMADRVQELVRNAALAALGTTKILGRLGEEVHEIDLAEPWEKVTVHDGVSAGLGEHITPDTTHEELAVYADKLGINYDPKWSRGALLTELYEHLCEERTVKPTFYYDFPAETSPLTRQHRDDDRLAERWDLVIFGAELGTAYSELVDPVIQRERLTEQSLLAAKGDPEAMELDEAFLTALEYGMPPAGGLGMGLDRLIMLLTNSSIRDTMTFPLVRPTR